MGRNRWALVAVLVLSFSVSPTISPAQPPDSKWDVLDRAVGKENYVEALKLADAIIQRGTPEDRQKAMMVYGRILLALGQKDRARQYLDALSKPGVDPSGGRLTTIYRAWLKALDGKPDKAIKTLEKVLAGADSAPDESAANAADVLAMLYMARGEKKNARKSVAFGLKTLDYLGVKSGYVLSLLRGRLNSKILDSQAKRLYDRAQGLRLHKKFVNAGKLFAEVRAMYPKNQWGHASGFRIGECYIGLNRSSQAIGWWQKFIEQSPAGPWRGQASVALVDLALAQLDLNRATKHVIAATAVLTKGLDKETAPSWKKATYDIHLRRGIVSLATGRFDAALQGFRKAKLNPASPAGIDRLIDASQRRAKLIPIEVTVGDDGATVALILGNIYNVLHQYDRAKVFFTMPLSGSARSRSSAHRSFAGLGLARATLGAARQEGLAKKDPPSGRSPLDQAKSFYEASLKEHPKGSWHDETLYCLATTIQDLVDAEFSKLREPAPGGKKADLKVEKEQWTRVVKAKAEALPYWRDIIKRFPQSPRCEQAFYNAGVLLYELAEVGPATTSEKRWKDADSMFIRLCEAYPKSPYACDAYVRQIDFALERKFDLTLATSLVDRGIEWAKNQKVKVVTAADGTLTQQSVADAARAIQNASMKLPEWAEPGTKPPASLLNDLYNLYLRAGILAYLQENYEEAAKYLNAAGPARPTDGMQAKFDLQKIGLHILIVCSKRKEPSWNPDAIKAAKTDSQKLALKLADTYLHSQRPEKAEAIYQHLLAGDSSLGRPNRAIEGYCLMQLALVYSQGNASSEKSIECYKRFYKKGYADLPWAATAIMRLAVLEYNSTQDPKRSIPHYQYLLLKYPNHREAERALYFLAIDAVQSGDKTLAESSCKEYIRRYDRRGWENSGWRDHIQRVLTDEVPKL